MPAMNGQGPRGQGPATGWGRGGCASGAERTAQPVASGWGMSRGRGRGRACRWGGAGMGLGRGWGWGVGPGWMGQEALTSESLRLQADGLRARLAAVEEEMARRGQSQPGPED